MGMVDRGERRRGGFEVVKDEKWRCGGVGGVGYGYMTDNVNLAFILDVRS